jgi:peptidoglycan/xylan/chitin deacetylase (PgdA/CDA1 family)
MRAGAMRLTILMYHKIDEVPAGAKNPANFVSPARFTEQMDALVSWGYESVTFDQWLDYRNGLVKTLPPKPLIVTFDDGYTCFADNAWPVMKRRGIRATVFLVSSQIGKTNAWDEGEVSLRVLDASRIRALRDDGVEFGSHSVSHRALTQLSAAEAFQELNQSRWALAELLEREVDVFAYPFSNQSRAVRTLAQQAGYRCAVRGKGRMCSRRTDPLGLYRIKVEPETTVASLRSTLFRERLRIF